MTDQQTRLHPDGFIEHDLPHGIKLHIWADDLPPAQRANTPIHDHCESYESHVIVGTLHHIVYTFSPHATGNYQLWGVEPWRTGDDSFAPLAGMVGDVEDFEHITVLGTYQFRAGLFHETKHDGFTATILHKTLHKITVGQRVAVPVGVKPNFESLLDDQLSLTPWVDRALEFVPADIRYGY